MDGKNTEITIDNLGWGTKSAIIIFYNLFLSEKAIVFIEEPEISMHPELLKRLFDWAFRETKLSVLYHDSLIDADR